MRRSGRPRPAIRSRRWQALRLSVLMAADWTCADCAGLAQEVDHIVPTRAGGSMWDASNLQPLCRSCHIKKSAIENGRRPRDDWDDLADQPL